MKLANIVEAEDPEWTIVREPLKKLAEIKRRMQFINHQAQLMMSKFEKYAKVYKGKVFAVTGLKSGVELPKQVQANPRKFQTFTCVHDPADIATKVFVSIDDPKIVQAVRELVRRHNELTNKRGELEGQMAKIKSELGLSQK